MTDESTKPELGDLEEPLNTLDGVVAALELMAASDDLDFQHRRGLSWVADRLFETAEELRATFRALHAAARAEKGAAT